MRSPCRSVYTAIPAIFDPTTFEQARLKREARSPERTPPRQLDSPSLANRLTPLWHLRERHDRSHRQGRAVQVLQMHPAPEPRLPRLLQRQYSDGATRQPAIGKAGGWDIKSRTLARTDS